MFAYCGNEPIGFADSNGYDCYVFYDKDFEKNAKDARNDLKSYYEIKDDNVHLIKVTCYSDFSKEWNKMGENDDEIQTVIIISHGKPYNLYGNGWSITTNSISPLKSKSIRGLILFGCNAGHYDYQSNNIAAVFAKKLGASTPVLASDGTVCGPCFGKYVSKADKNFYNLCKWGKYDNFGWLIYSYSGSINVIKLNTKSLTIKQMIKEIEKYT